MIKPSGWTLAGFNEWCESTWYISACAAFAATVWATGVATGRLDPFSKMVLVLFLGSMAVQKLMAAVCQLLTVLANDGVEHD